MPELDADFEISTNNLEAEYEISEGEHFDCSFEIFASGTVWGAITGDIENQTDLNNALNSKADANAVEQISETIGSYGDIVTHNVDEFATSIQGGLADTALQSGDNITELENNAGYITSSALDGYATTNELTEGLATKQDTISDLSDIRSDASKGADAYDTIQGYGDIVTYNASAFATSIQGGLADTALQPNDDITELNNNAGYITSASLPTVNNSSIKFQKNGTDVKTITLNQSGNDTVNFSIPTQASDINAVPTSRTVNSKSLANNISLSASDVGALANTTTINDLTTTTQQNALNSGATSTNIGQITTNANNISDIQDLIPTQATTTNQLADKSFVNSSIATNTANFIGTFQSVAELEAYSGTLTNNDYAFVETTDSAGNTLYDRYKWNGTEWLFEYELNNSSFTSNQWAAINSGANSTNIGQIVTNTNDIQAINTTIGGYGDIVTHNTSEFATASQGSKADTALQPNDDISELNNDSGYITGITSSDVTTALGYTPYDNSNPDGYITGITSSDVTTALGYTPYNSTNPNGYMPTKPAITNSTNLSTLDTGVYPVNGVANSDLPSTSRMFGTLIQYDGTYRPQLLVAGLIAGDSNVTGVYNRRYLTSASSYTAWEKLGEGTVKSVNNISPDGNGDVSLTIPTVNDGTLTITQNGTTVGTFSANQSGNDTIPLTDTTYTTFTGADSITGGTSGLVPAPSAGDEDRFLKVNGTWDTISGGGGTVDQTYDPTSANAQSGVAVAEAITSGKEVFIATYGTTTYQEVLNAYNDGKTLFAQDVTNNIFYTLSHIGSSAFTFSLVGVSAQAGGTTIVRGLIKTIIVSSNGWEILEGQLQSTYYLTTSINSSSTDTQYPSAKLLYDQLELKQATLVSGTNIKTINNNSILGSGDISIIQGHTWGTTRPTSTTSTVSSTNPAVVIQNYVNGTSWYRIWSDKWCEQGGVVTPSSDTSNYAVSLLKTYASTYYNITTTLERTASWSSSTSNATNNASMIRSAALSTSHTSSTFYIGRVDSGCEVIWKATGYIS